MAWKPSALNPHYREHVIVTDRRKCIESCFYIRIQQSQQLSFRFSFGWPPSLAVHDHRGTCWQCQMVSQLSRNERYAVGCPIKLFFRQTLQHSSSLRHPVVELREYFLSDGHVRPASWPAIMCSRSNNCGLARVDHVGFGPE